MAPSAALVELLAGCPVAAGAFGAAAAAVQAGGTAKHLAALVAAAARGAVQAGSCTTAVELDDGASGACTLLKDMEEVLLAVGKAAGRSDKPGISEAKRLLRDRGPPGARLAARLGLLSRARNVAGHPGVALAADILGVFEATRGSDGGDGSSSDGCGAPPSGSEEEQGPKCVQALGADAGPEGVIGAGSGLAAKRGEQEGGPKECDAEQHDCVEQRDGVCGRMGEQGSAEFFDIGSVGDPSEGLPFVEEPEVESQEGAKSVEVDLAAHGAKASQGVVDSTVGAVQAQAGTEALGAAMLARVAFQRGDITEGLRLLEAAQAKHLESVPRRPGECSG
ncbi:unnamed protein product [Prorocentrum cordatum]|uniref:Uncharacterized protein n=1 Tax=Prorocentrum cordatum TaxID=2364126 RepID=A0ABN9Y356_9DINO|nr:unnamed protein product [Polarella glacialis]